MLALIAVPATFATLSGGSTFESGDGNLARDGSASFHDWNSPVEAITCLAAVPSTGTNCGRDLVKNQGDNSLGQGAKEDDIAPSVVSGSIPPSKDDLSRFYVNKEIVGGNEYLYLAWERSNLLGSAHMDFEFNQSSTASANGVTPVRTAGDLLIDFDFGGSGVPVLAKHTWKTTGNPATICEANNVMPCWDKAVVLGANAEAQVNSVAVTDAVGPGASFDLTGNTKNGINSTFGEAGINLTGSQIFQSGTCTRFGSATLKSRSSGNSFTSELKDFIAPIPVNITNCGTVNIHKQDDLGSPLSGVTFTLYTDNAPLGGSAPHGAEDTATTLTCSTNASGNCSIANVPFGKYWAVEGTPPSGYTGAADQYVDLNQNTANLTISLTFVNTRQPGAIKITKTSAKDDSALAGATFSITSSGTAISGSPFTTDANGKICVDGLNQGDYVVTETGAPANYGIDDATGHTVTVDNAATCAAGTYAGESISFSDTPLSKIQVKFFSLAGSGVTKASIVCNDGTDDVDAVAENGSDDPAFDDTDESFTNLLPGTYTCTVVVDP